MSGRKDLTKYRSDCCGLCGITDIRVLVVHHKIPVCEGGTNDLENLQTLCANCHKKKHLTRHFQNKDEPLPFWRIEGHFEKRPCCSCGERLK